MKNLFQSVSTIEGDMRFVFQNDEEGKIKVETTSGQPISEESLEPSTDDVVASEALSEAETENSLKKINPETSEFTIPLKEIVNLNYHKVMGAQEAFTNIIGSMGENDAFVLDETDDLWVIIAKTEGNLVRRDIPKTTSLDSTGFNFPSELKKEKHNQNIEMLTRVIIERG